MKLGNLDGVQAWRAGGPPPGTYVCKIDDAKEGTSSGGHPQIELSWTVATGEFTGAEIREWITVPQSGPGADIGRQKIVALLKATGIDYSSSDFELNPQILIDRQAEVVMRSEPKWNDPEKMVTKPVGHRPGTAPLATAAVNGNGAASAQTSDEEDLPFLWRPVERSCRESNYNPFD